MNSKTTSPALAVTDKHGPENDTRNYFAAPVPACGKAAAIALFNYEILSLDRVDTIFAQHPEWRGA